MNKKEEFDFGFTTEYDPSIELKDTVKNLTDESSKYKARMIKLYDTIIPLLNNLEKNPDQEMIKWPNRDKKVKEFKQKLNDIMDGKL